MATIQHKRIEPRDFGAVVEIMDALGLIDDDDASGGAIDDARAHNAALARMEMRGTAERKRIKIKFDV